MIKNLYNKSISNISIKNLTDKIESLNTLSLVFHKHFLKLNNKNHVFKLIKATKAKYKIATEFPYNYKVNTTNLNQRSKNVNRNESLALIIKKRS